MMRNTKPLIGAVGALLAAGLAVYFWTLRTGAGKTYHLANGIVVTAREVPRDDVAEALDVRVWKFDVVVPDHKRTYMMNLSQYDHGSFVRSLGGGGVQPTNQGQQVTLSLSPIGGDISSAPQIRGFMKAGSGIGSNHFTNPLRNLGGFADGLSASPVDNRLYLIGGGKQPFFHVGNNDVDIGIEFTQELPLLPKP